MVRVFLDKKFRVLLSKIQDNVLKQKIGKQIRTKNQNVFVDDIQSSSQNRAKILQEYVPESTTIQAEDFLSLNREKGREFTKEYKLIYIYQNGIDATGDNFKSESKVFDAVEKEFVLIKKIIKQIINFLAPLSNAICKASPKF